MVAPKTRWTDVLGHSTMRVVAENRTMKEALRAILAEHEEMPVLFEQFGICAVCDGAIEWPCSTAKRAQEALDSIDPFHRQET